MLTQRFSSKDFSSIVDQVTNEMQEYRRVGKETERVILRKCNKAEVMHKEIARSACRRKDIKSSKLCNSSSPRDQPHLCGVQQSPNNK